MSSNPGALINGRFWRFSATNLTRQSKVSGRDRKGGPGQRLGLEAVAELLGLAFRQKETAKVSPFYLLPAGCEASLEPKRGETLGNGSPQM
jgi:hypothetical protein